MKTAKNGKGDTPRNNWGPGWRSGYDAIDWRRPRTTKAGNAAQTETPAKDQLRSKQEQRAKA